MVVVAGRRRLELALGLGFLVCLFFCLGAEAKCRRGCDLALASYNVWLDANLTFISEVMNTTTQTILNFNPQVTSKDVIITDTRINIPFPCDCINEEYLGRVFVYSVRSGDTYDQIAKTYYANLTTSDWLASLNSYSATNIPDNGQVNVTVNCSCGDSSVSNDYGLFVTYPLRPGENLTSVASDFNLSSRLDLLQRYNPNSNFSSGQLVFIPARGIPDNAHLNVTVNCSCGDSSVSKDYGLFTTYPLRPVDTLASVASEFNISASLLQSYNPNTNFSLGSGLVFVPTKDQTGSYRPLNSSAGISSGAIAGISIAVVAGTLLLAVSVYFQIYKRKKAKGAVLLTTAPDDSSTKHGHGTLDKTTEIVSLVGASPGLTGLTVEKSVEFSYEELAEATNDFNLAGKIGQGGFGSVYYAELRGQKAAIKKMDMKASREFLAELKVLTRVHHLNLVRLIGYCIEGSLCLVYEFIDNGNLSQHLHGFGREPLTWSTRVQIALDSARGLEYIHEHTVPVYIHRDIKSANILIDKNFHGKVADFGLTKLTEVGSASLSTRLAGTFGYMPPEYAQYGDVSPKVDVYAFGVVLYELISAKEAIVRTNGSETESKGLVGLFEDVLSQPEPKENLRKLVDPRLGDNYPLDSVHKMAQLARACTHETPAQRPSMRSVGVALMALSSSTGDWDVGTFYENQALVNLMSGR